MATFGRSSIVLIHFPFSDLSQTKLRPALVLSQTTKDDFILCQIPSNARADEQSIEIVANDFAEGSLQKMSYIRPNKIFTAHKSLITKRVGILRDEKMDEITASIINILKRK